MAANKKAVSFSLGPDQIARLDAVARRTRIPRSVLVREALDKILDEYETQYSLDLPDKSEEGTN